MGSVGVVLDTNVLVSALGFGGTPLEALLRTFDDDVRLLTSEAALDELDRVMRYDHLPFTDADRIQFLSILRTEADVVDPTRRSTPFEIRTTTNSPRSHSTATRSTSSQVIATCSISARSGASRSSHRTSSSRSSAD